MLWGNKELWDSYEQNSEESYNSKGEKVLSFGVEAMFKGNNAKEFMSRQGYSLVPTQQTIYESKSLFRPMIGKGNIVFDQEYRISEKSTYLKKGAMEYNRTGITRPLTNPNYAEYSFEFIRRYNIHYTNNWGVMAVVKLMNFINLDIGINTAPTFVKSWDDFKNDKGLIKDFRELYGTQ